MRLKISITKLVIAIVLAFLALDLWFALVYLPAEAEKEWQAERKKLIDRGEKLSIADFAAEKVQDERNFFADPLWAELHDREPVRKDGITYQETRKKSEEWALDVLKKPFDAAERKSLETEFPAFVPLDKNKTKQAALRSHWEAAQKSSDTALAARFVLKALAPTEPVIMRLRELGARPEAYFPLSHKDGPLMAVEHVVPILYSSQWLQLHASALLALGESEAAFRDVQLIFRLARSLGQDTILIAILVDMTTVNLAAGVVGRGIRDHAWSEAELVEFDRELARIDLPARLAVGLRAERAYFLEATIPLVKEGGMPFLRKMSGVEQADGFSAGMGRPVFWVYSLYSMPGDKIFYSQAIQQWVEALDLAPGKGMRPGYFFDFASDYRENNPSNWDKARRISSLLSLPSLMGSFRKAAKVQTDVSQTRIAIALERYRMKHGEYPEKLDAVVPEFLAKLPLDLITMEPFHYRREASGKFTLWSVGWDEIDDEGAPGKKDDEGDWVWGAVAGEASPQKGEGGGGNH